MSQARLVRELVADAREPHLRSGLWRARATVLAALAFGAALLALAGWFIAASAVAGVATATTFSFLYPSGGVQALALARTLGRYRERLTTHEVTLRLAGLLRVRTFARTLDLDPDRVARLRSSDLLARITADADAVENILLRSAFPALAAGAAVTGATVVFCVVSRSVALVAVLAFVLSLAALVGAARRQVGRPAAELIASRARARAEVVELVDGLPELRSFGAEHRAAEELLGSLGRYDAARRRLAVVTAHGQTLGGLLADFTLLVVALAAAGLVLSPRLPAPVFVMVALIVVAAFEAIVNVPAALVARSRATSAAARLLNALAPALDPGEHCSPQGRWSVAARLGHERAFVAEPGETVWLSGRSGAGKSTLLRALSGQPAPGIEARVAGVAPQKIAPDVLVQHVTLVAQDAYVFDGTIRQNLQLAGADATDDDMWQALTAAAVAQSVALMPLGLDTHVGPGGANLSGGQQRRLAVAMGLLRRPDVLLLDEPTEGLDGATAAELLGGVRQYLPNACIVLAIHDRQAPSVPWVPTVQLDLGGDLTFA